MEICENFRFSLSFERTIHLRNVYTKTNAHLLRAKIPDSKHTIFSARYWEIETDHNR